MIKEQCLMCPICKKDRLHRIQYDLCYCHVCGREFALGDKGLSIYKSIGSGQHAYKLLKKLNSKQVIHFRRMMSKSEGQP